MDRWMDGRVEGWMKMVNRMMIMRMETTMTMITTSADRIRRDSQDDDDDDDDDDDADDRRYRAS